MSPDLPVTAAGPLPSGNGGSGPSALGPDPLLGLRLDELALGAPLVVAADAPLAQAASSMHAARAAACLVRGEGYAILTERDILRAVAQGRTAATAGELASAPLVTVAGHELLAEAFARMVEKSIRRLVLVDAAGQPQAIVEERDLLSARGENPVYLAGLADRAADGRALAVVFDRLRAMVLRAVAEGVSMEKVGRLMAHIADAIMVRAARLAGFPEGGFALAVLGSEGRREQFLATDQDNLLVLADDADADGWEALAGHWVELLVAAGLPACPKGIMASTPQWRMSASGWENLLDGLFQRADAQAFLRLSLLADMRPVLGDVGLTETVAARLRRGLADNPMVLRYMAREALRFEPPLTFFGSLSSGLLDLKKGGIFPVMQGVKVLALEHGLAATSTWERLDGLRAGGHLSPAMWRNLRETYEFFQALRVRGQAARLAMGQMPDNAVDPQALSGLERDRLRHGLKLVAEFQGMLSEKYRLRLLT